MDVFKTASINALLKKSLNKADLLISFVAFSFIMISN